MRAAPRVVPLLAFALLGAGCLGASTQQPLDGAALATSGTIWERGLATSFETPAVAALRSDAERRADVSPPGAPEFAAFDAAMEAWMQKFGIVAGQVSLMHGGKLRYESGYGFADEAMSRPVDPLTMFRIASVSKPIAGAVVAMQVEEGLYNWSDPVFCLPPAPATGCRLDIPIHPARPLKDERLRDVTVEMLRDHVAGWAYSASDHLAGEANVEVARTLGVPSPPPAWRLAQFALGEELADDPGTRRQYCNICYVMLGLVAESATGVDLRALEEAYVFRPLEVSGDIQGGFTRLAERDPREPFYACEYGEDGPSVYEPGETGCHADVAFAIEHMVAAGGLISTTSAAAAIYEVYESVFSLDAGPVHLNGHDGSLPGTATFVGTVASPAGEVQYAVFFNGHGPDGIDATSVYDLEWAMIAAASAWGATEELTSA